MVHEFFFLALHFAFIHQRRFFPLVSKSSRSMELRRFFFFWSEELRRIQVTLYDNLRPLRVLLFIKQQKSIGIETCRLYTSSIIHRFRFVHLGMKVVSSPFKRKKKRKKLHKQTYYTVCSLFWLCTGYGLKRITKPHLLKIGERLQYKIMWFCK